MRLGGSLFIKYDDPDSWVNAVKSYGYNAAFSPVSSGVEEHEARAYVEVAKRDNIVISEVGTWSNPISPDETERASALDKCKKGLLLAELIGARCCVNIAGSRGAKWDGPDADDLTKETFQMIVDTVREIIDAVNPVQSFYTLETMPWMYPDSVDAYLKLIQAIDRKAFAVHLDPVNLICSPHRYFNNGNLIKECFSKLGPYIRSCHAKDITLRDNLTVHLDEVCPGLGALDYGVYLKELDKLDPDIPLMLEHLPNEEAYKAAASYIKKTAKEDDIVI